MDISLDSSDICVPCGIPGKVRKLVRGHGGSTFKGGATESSVLKGYGEIMEQEGFSWAVEDGRAEEE